MPRVERPDDGRGAAARGVPRVVVRHDVAATLSRPSAGTAAAALASAATFLRAPPPGAAGRRAAELAH